MRNYIGLPVLIAAAILSGACSQHYNIVRSNRIDYPIGEAVQSDSAVLRKVMPYKLRLDSQMNAVIGHTAIALTKKSIGGESLLGNFFSDAALAESRKIHPKIDFAMPSTNGGLRNDLPKGPLKLSNVFELMPFENELLVFELSGQHVQSLLDFIAGTGGQPVAGISLKIKDRKAYDVLIGGKPFDSSRSYRILTSDYIAGGGDNMNSFKQPMSKTVVGLKVRDALIRYIQGAEAAGKEISAVLDRRISNDQ